MIDEIVGKLDYEQLKEYRRLSAIDDLIEGGNFAGGPKQQEWAIEQKILYLEFAGDRFRELLAEGDVEEKDIARFNIEPFIGRMYLGDD